jgi:hypothetical protein
MNFQRILPTATGKHKGNKPSGMAMNFILNISRKLSIFAISNGRIVLINGRAQFARPFRGIFKYGKFEMI